MHMEGPWLTTTGKKKGKKKWASAEHKRRAELAAAYKESLYSAYNITHKKRNKQAFIAPTYNPTFHPRYIDDSAKKIPSLSTNTGGNTGRVEPRVYSGERTLLGIATMHKSNMVPVFSTEEATEISRMRRG